MLDTTCSIQSQVVRANQSKVTRANQSQVAPRVRTKSHRESEPSRTANYSKVIPAKAGIYYAFRKSF